MAARLGFWLRDAAPLHGAGFWKKMRLEIFGFGQGPCSTFGPLCPHYGVFFFLRMRSLWSWWIHFDLEIDSQPQRESVDENNHMAMDKSSNLTEDNNAQTINTFRMMIMPKRWKSDCPSNKVYIHSFSTIARPMKLTNHNCYKSSKKLIARSVLWFAEVQLYTDKAPTQDHIDYQYKNWVHNELTAYAMSGEIQRLLSISREQLFLRPSEDVNNVISKSVSCQGLTQ